jgi:hypothetical protein
LRFTDKLTNGNAFVKHKADFSCFFLKKVGFFAFKTQNLEEAKANFAFLRKFIEFLKYFVLGEFFIDGMQYFPLYSTQKI